MIFVGNDWAEDHHDVWVMNAEGAQLAVARIPEGLDGLSRFHQLVGAHADEPDQVVIGIETEDGLWVQALAAGGYQVYAINPLAVARYRDRHRVSGAKSDPQTPRCSPSWCAPTGTIIAGWSVTARRSRRSRCSRERISR